MLVVQKYGGTSVGSPERIKEVALRISRSVSSGNKVVVVVSAMGDTTDELIELAGKVSSHIHEREMDMLLSVGERVSMALLSMALRDLGCSSISFTGSQAGIITDESHTCARILEIKPFRVQKELDAGKVVIVAGFQGVSLSKEITTLGRGGSDTTAVALAAELKADRCEVFTDVEGVFSADPRRVSKAQRFKTLSLDLMRVMASQGAQVMHARSIEIAKDRNMELFVGHFQTGEGTMLMPMLTQGMELSKVVAVVLKKGLVFLKFPRTSAVEIIEELKKQNISTNYLELNKDELLLAVYYEEASQWVKKHELKIWNSSHLSQLSLVGVHLQQNTEVISRALKVLSDHRIEPICLTTQPQSNTLYLTEADALKAEAVLHKEFLEN